MTGEDARWLALFLDTEGCICVRKHYRQGRYLDYQIRVALSNTCRPLVEQAQRLVGAGTIQRELNRHRRRPMFHLVLAGRTAGVLLKRLSPYLIVKPRRAAIATAVQSLSEANGRGRKRSGTHLAALDRAWLAIKSLNKRGEWIEAP